MKRKFVTNLILLLFLNLLVKPFWILGIDRTVQNLVGDESYGLYFALFNFSLILKLIPFHEIHFGEEALHAFRVVGKIPLVYQSRVPLEQDVTKVEYDGLNM